MKQLHFILKYAKPHEKKLFMIIFDVAIYAAMMLVSPLIVSTMVDHIIQGIPVENPVLNWVINQLGGFDYLQQHLWIGGLLIVVTFFLIALAINRKIYHCGILSETFARNLRNAVYDHLQKLPFSYHKMKDSGDLIQRSTSDIDTIRRFLSSYIAEMFYSLLIILIATMILLSKSIKLTIISMILLPLILVASKIFYGKSKKIFLDCDLAESKMMAVIQENLNATRVVKAFHQEKKEIDKFEEVNETYRIKLNEMIHALAVFWNVSDFIGAFQLFLMVMGGIYFAYKGEITAGTFFVFLTYENMIIWPIRQLGRILADMGKLSVAIGRIEEILNEPCEDLNSGLTPQIKGDIVFDHVSFAYPDSEEEILKDLSFHIKPYTKTAIMGATGSGKSSLIHLLNGIYDYSSGSIKLDGVELREINKHHLRRNVQLVLQEPFLYSKTIYENIVLPSYENNQEEVEKAAQSARIHHVIEEFDQGYDTEVGEKGVMLSGGQKQRMAIARSLIVHSPVVIFDDSLSALDAKTDAKIQEELSRLDNLMTTIMVTHRINTACKADMIIMLEKGRIVQCGSHEELIHQEGIYQRIYQIQNEGGEKDVIS